MPELETELPEFHLHIGEIRVARTPTILKTVLGSCIGVTFWSPRIGIGALCHGALPRCPPGVFAPEAYRYVDFAIGELIRQFEAAGARRQEMQVKVFGGADVLLIEAGETRKPTVGSLNWQMAMETLRDEKLRVLASDLGGLAGRVIQFNTGSGEVLLRRLGTLAEQLDQRLARGEL
jgi:chemotaxis protein CheD